MPWKESKAGSEGNDPTPQDAGKMIRWEKLRQVLSETWGEALKLIKEDSRRMHQCVASLKLDARLPRLAMEADVPADEKTCERTEGAAKAVQAIRRGSFSAKSVQDGPKSSTTFGVKAEPSALPCRDDLLVENGAAAPKSCLSPLEMRTPKAAGGLLLTGKAFAATRTTSDQPSLWFCLTEETHLRTSILYASYYSSFYLRAAPSCRRVIETKLGQKIMFDPGSFIGHLCACLFWGIWRTLLCGEILRLGAGWYPRV